MQLAEKKQFVKEFSEEIKNAKSIILTHYQGLDVNNITKLRRKLKDADCTMRVIKNRLALRAIEETGIESYSAIKESFKGPVAILIGNDDPSRAIKIFKEYTDKNKLMEFKVGVIMDNIFDSSQIEKIAGLPSKDVMLTKTVIVLNAPIQGLYNTLSGVIKKLFYALSDLKEKKGEGETKVVEEPAEEAPAETPPEQETSTDELPKEEVLKEESKEQEKVTEKEYEIKAVEETAVKEVPKQEAPVEAAPEQETSTEEVPKEEVPKEESEEEENTIEKETEKKDTKEDDNN